MRVIEVGVANNGAKGKSFRCLFAGRRRRHDENVSALTATSVHGLSTCNDTFYQTLHQIAFQYGKRVTLGGEYFLACHARRCQEEYTVNSHCRA